MNKINEKTLKRLQSIQRNIGGVGDLSGRQLKDLPLEYKSKDYMVNMHEPHENAFIKKIAVTNDPVGIPNDALDELLNTDKKKSIIFSRISHIIKKILEK